MNFVQNRNFYLNNYQKILKPKLQFRQQIEGYSDAIINDFFLLILSTSQAARSTFAASQCYLSRKRYTSIMLQLHRAYNKFINKKLMYSDRFFQPRTTRTILTITSAILLPFAFIHFVYAGILGKNTESVYQVFVPYFAILGATLIITNVFYISLIQQCITSTKQKLVFIITLLIIEFAMTFAAAVITSIVWTNDSLSITNQLRINNQRAKSLTEAQALVNFLVAAPSTLLHLGVILDTNIYVQQNKQQAYRADVTEGNINN